MKYSEAFEILERHGLEPSMVYADHEQISVDIPDDRIDDLLDDPEWEELTDFGFFLEEGYMVKYV